MLVVAIFVPGIVASSFARDAGAHATTATTKITKATISSATRSATFEFVATGGVANGFECSLTPKGKAAVPTSCLSPAAYTNLALKQYTFSVFAQQCHKKVCLKFTTAQRSFRIN